MLIFIGILHALAIMFYLYWQWGEFDSFMHFLGGLCVSLAFTWFYFYSGLFVPKNRQLSNFLLISSLSLIFVGVTWEIFELLAKLTFVHWRDYFSDTSLDLVMDFLGSMVGAFYAYIREIEHQKKEQDAIQK